MANDSPTPPDPDASESFPDADITPASPPDSSPEVQESINPQWQGEIQRVQGLPGELRRLSTLRFVDLEHLSGAFLWFDELRQMRGCGRLEGVAQVGKTVAARVYAMRYRRKPGSDSPQSVAYVRLPPGAGLGEWYGRLLESLGEEPGWGGLSQLRRQGLRVARERSLRLVLVDNADQQSPKLLQEVRYLSERLWVGIVLIGPQRLSDRLSRDPDLAAAFQPLYWIPTLGDDALKTAITKWETDVLQLPERSHLDEEGAFEIVRDVTQGCVGRLDMILRRSAMRALKAGKHAIDRDVLDEVIQDYR